MRILVFACATLLPSVIAVPEACAAGADGVYKFTRVSGSFVVNGKPVDVSVGVLKYALFQNGRLVILNNKLPIYRFKWSGLMEDFNYLGITGAVKVTGPSNLELKRSGGSYIGSTTRPVSLTLSGRYLGTSISLTMRMKFSAKVKGDTLSVMVPITMSAMGVDLKGSVKMVAKR